MLNKHDSERREKESMPQRSGAFSMAREDNPITGNTGVSDRDAQQIRIRLSGMK
jgi:hypothetical protein